MPLSSPVALEKHPPEGRYRKGRPPWPLLGGAVYLLLLLILVVLDPYMLTITVIGWRAFLKFAVLGAALWWAERRIEKSWPLVWLPAVILWVVWLDFVRGTYSLPHIFTVIITLAVILNSRSLKFYQDPTVELWFKKILPFLGIAWLINILLGGVPYLAFEIKKASMPHGPQLELMTEYLHAFLLPLVLLTPLAVTFAAGYGDRRAAALSYRIASLLVLMLIVPLALTRAAFPEVAAGKPSPTVIRLLSGSYYHLRWDRSTGRLLATTKKSSLKIIQPPELHKTGNWTTRSFPFREIEQIQLDEKARRIYYMDRDQNALVTFDADSFKVLAERPTSGICTGSTRVGVDAFLKRVFVSCENGQLLAVDDQSGQVLREFYYGHTTDFLHDELRHRVFLALEGDLVRLDGASLTIQKVRTPHRVDELALSSLRNRIFLSAPLARRILVYNADTLKLEEEIKSFWGVRALAVDDRRGLLFAAGVFSNRMEIVDLNSRQTRAVFEVGNWMRRITLDEKHRRAYVSSARDGLFMIPY